MLRTNVVGFPTYSDLFLLCSDHDFTCYFPEEQNASCQRQPRHNAVFRPTHRFNHTECQRDITMLYEQQIKKAVHLGTHEPHSTSLTSHDQTC